jgi:hypothetical protein
MASHSITSWRSPSFASQPIDRWRSMNIKDGRISIVGETEIPRKSHLINTTFVCPPSGAAFVNPLRVPEIATQIFSKWRTEQIIVSTLIFAVALMLWLGGARRGGDLGATFILLDLFLIVNVASTPSPHHLAERSEFITSVYLAARKSAWFVALVSVASFIASQFGFGTFNSAAYAYGAIISKVLQGQFWRVATGPFIHYTFSAWLINSAVLGIVFPVASFCSFPSGAMIFLGGSTLSEVAYIVIATMGFPHADLLVGFSGGTFALLGFILVSALKNKACFPHKFWALVAAFILLNMLGAQLTVFHASLIAHISGLLFGILTGLCIDITMGALSVPSGE